MIAINAIEFVPKAIAIHIATYTLQRLHIHEKKDLEKVFFYN